MLGLPDVNVTIHGSTFKKVMQDKHNVTAETLKQLPSQINDPVAVMKSITHDKSYIVLTELVEQENGWNKPIIAALHLKQDKNGLELVNIASVYGRSKSQIQKGLNDDLLYWNDKKGTDFANTFGLQLPAYASLKQSTGSDIKTEADLRQYQSDNSANVNQRGEHTFAEAIPRRTANSFDEVRNIVSELLGEPLVNQKTGMIATLSKRSLDKLLSGKATGKSTNVHDHLMAVANIDQLFENAVQGWVEPHKNNDPNIAGVHRMFAPLNIDGEVKLAKLTIKAMNFDQGNKIYSVETIEVENENGILGNLEATANQDDKLTSPQNADVDSLVQRIKDFNDRSRNITQNSANEIRYSRQSVEDLAATGKAKDDHTSLFQDLISRDVTRLTERWGKATAKLDEIFADSLRPISDWIDNLPALEENGKALIKGRMYRAKNLRDVARSELEAKFMQPLQKELSELAKKYQKDPLSTKRIVGFWASLRYSVIRNQRLLETDKKAVDDAQLALEEAQQSGKQSAIDKAARAYRAAERQYRYRQEDVNSTQFGKGAEDVPFKVGTAGGWSIPEAQAYMAGLEKHIAKADMEKVLANLYAMQKYMLLLDSKSGRYTPEQIKEYMADQYYVPLTGDPNMSEDTGFIGGVGSRSLNISRDKALKGRTASEAEDAFDAVWKAVGKTTTFYGWQPFKQSLFDSYNARVDELTEKGMAEKSAKEQASAELGISVQKLMGLTRPNDNVLIHKDLGEYYEIHLPDNVVKNLKEDNVEVANRWTTWVSKPTRMMARGVTQLTYDFAPKNMFRDTWDKSDLIRDQKIYDKNGKALSQAAKNKIGRAVWFNALNPNKGIWKATNKFARGQSLDINSDNEAERAMAQLVQYGGLSSFTQMIAKTEEDFIQQVRRKGTAKGVFVEQLAGYVEAYNGTFDYVSSLATFKALVDNNVDPEQAASLTLDLSNFRKTGTATKSLKGFFMFLQPKMMGASVLLKSLNTPSGKLRFARQVTASMLIYNALALAFASMFGDDEAGNKLDMLGDITGFIPIPIPWADENSEHKFWKLPLGFGSAQLAWNMAVNVSRAARGSISATDASVNVVTNFGKVFAPVSPSDISASKDPVAKLVLTLTPSIALPVIQLGFNRDAFGRPIHTTFERGEKIKAEQGKANTADAWEHIALSLYDMTGGVIDMYPESVKHLINGYALPLGSFREATNILIENPNREKLGKTQRPVLLRSLVGNVNEFAVQTTFYEAMEEAQATHKAYTRFKETGQLSDWVTPEKMQEVRFYELAQKRTGELRSLKAKRTKALNKGTLSQDAYDKWIREVYVPHTDKVQRAFVNKWRREHGLDTTLQSGTPKL
ncbi:hypothetical protein A6B43_08680 [Vespertiliibacter pulmonis]|uniref:Phage MuF C-terminal domain-containing protein n=1 Tax=Vespertiliibacter pulmonis TaxID=1443036 RepID=A0A3N4W4C7_9PAST|nr:LPD38 domain-containing protein [Vespertiliibacter pulmonis]QLB20058.1 hypothetical protein A6B43_00155 [Vespertiliibacter pulmonis]QLB21594.1 hypothetical protein A6B43_08680 [Vespertiliibacter pulmonis]RPE86021.1 hypothetical protein EDC46_0412 [Vespertiliibacter pulmonis]